ncbi:uncharacterized protein LOC133179207 [Saccostrea echinata]|uniref:uncharacterized protein LOC133179207 n=1 Tax=Saccostrea echinata TaxID=191078 RepID=UPI002A82D288|nr:uncharacterized protein LOC133179207 [Saccostrea echinata]
MDSRYLMDKISRFFAGNFVSPSLIMSLHHWTEIAYNSVFWAVVLWSSTDLIGLVIYSAYIVLSLSIVLVIILIIFNKSDSTISEYIFLAFWGIFSYFTNCSIRMPTSEDVLYDSQIFSPEAGSLRYFAIALLVARTGGDEHFTVWIISVTCTSLLLNYLCVQMHATDFEGTSDERNTGTFSRKLSYSLLLIILFTSYLHSTSVSSFAITLLMTFFRIQYVIKTIEGKLKEKDGDLLNRSEIYYCLLSAFYIGAYAFFIKTSQRNLLSVPMVFLSIETLYYIYIIFENIWILRGHKQNFWRNTTTIPKNRRGEQCPVCLAEIWSGRMTSCSHVFHSSCLVRCLRQSPVCPMCRSVINDKKLT